MFIGRQHIQQVVSLTESSDFRKQYSELASWKRCTALRIDFLFNSKGNFASFRLALCQCNGKFWTLRSVRWLYLTWYNVRAQGVSSPTWCMGEYMTTMKAIHLYQKGQRNHCTTFKGLDIRSQIYECKGPTFHTSNCNIDVCDWINAIILLSKF